jgi:ribosomal protein S8
MKHIILFVMAMVAIAMSASARDSYTVKVTSMGKGKGYKIRAQIYKGNSKSATYHVHLYSKPGSSAVSTCKKVTYSKAATYIPVEVVTKYKSEYGCVIYKNGKKVYTKSKGSKVSALIKAEKCFSTN